MKYKELTPELLTKVNQHSLWHNSGQKNGAQLVIDEEEHHNFNFSKRNLNDCIIVDSNLVQGDFSSADLYRARLCSTSFDKCNFSLAILSRANFDYASLCESNFFSAKAIKSSFYQSKLNKSSFKEADLSASHFHEAELCDATFDNSTLDNANFSKCDLRGASFRNCDLSSTLIDNAIILDDTFSGSTGINTAKINKLFIYQNNLKYPIEGDELQSWLQLQESN